MLPRKETLNMRNIIEIEHLSKSFGDVKAVQDISFQVKEGELFAFLGINGAGKSTTIGIICGQLKKDDGTVTINGQSLDGNIDKIKNEIGVVFQDSVLDKALSVRDNLQSRAALYGIKGDAFKKRLAELAKLLEFEDLLKRPVGKLSGGQRRRIDIARALLNEPKILILDEPTTGLDPQTRKTLWDVISTLRKEKNMTVFLTTHYMEEAADADYVVILDSGKISAQGTPLELKNTYTGDFITIYGVSEEQVQALGRPYEAIRDAYRVSVPNTADATELIIKHADMFKDYEITKGKMDDVFLAVTGKKLNGGEKQ
ncbi:MAG: ABC transporter ATP-binding protein [Tyzzerella sp.]|nr:ABC transporter ATP-binding protein [Tyzzerella sp.]